MNDAELAVMNTRMDGFEEKLKTRDRKIDELEKEVDELNAVMQRGRGAVYVLGALGVFIGMALGWFEEIAGLFK